MATSSVSTMDRKENKCLDHWLKLRNKTCLKLVRKTILIRNLCLLWDSVHAFSAFQKSWLLSSPLSCLFFFTLLELNLFLRTVKRTGFYLWWWCNKSTCWLVNSKNVARPSENISLEAIKAVVLAKKCLFAWRYCFCLATRSGSDHSASGQIDS